MTGRGWEEEVGSSPQLQLGDWGHAGGAGSLFGLEMTNLALA